MRSSSLKLLLNAGIESPRDFRDKLIHEWFLLPEESKHLDEYFLTAIPAKDFFELINEGELEWKNFLYQVIWIHKPVTVKHSGKAIVSFRYCKMLGCGYALVKRNNLEKDKILPPGNYNAIITKATLSKDKRTIAILLKRS